MHPGEWTKIAAIVERTEQDCRDRWNKEIANIEKRNTGESPRPERGLNFDTNATSRYLDSSGGSQIDPDPEGGESSCGRVGVIARSALGFGISQDGAQTRTDTMSGEMVSLQLLPTQFTLADGAD